MAPQLDPRGQALWCAYRQAASEIQSLEDQELAYESATQLADRLRDMADQAAQIRAASAARIQQAEGLSLMQLAERLGLSKARASQLVQAARADQGERSHAGDVSSA